MRTSFLGLPIARRPNISVSVLNQSIHHSKGLRTRSGDTPEVPIFEDIQSVIDSYPQVPRMVFQHRVTCTPGRPLPLVIDETLPLTMWSSDSALATQIEPSLLARTPPAKSDHAFHLGECCDRRIAETVYSTCSCSPNDPFAVLKKSPYGVAGKTFRMSIMVHSVSMDTKEPVLLGANPKVAVAVEHHGGNGESASIEGGASRTA